MFNNSYYKYSGMRWWYRNLWWIQIVFPCVIVLTVASVFLYNWHQQHQQQRQDEYMEQMWEWWRKNPPELESDLDEKNAAWRAIRQKQDDPSFPISHEKKQLIVKHWDYLINGMSVDEVQRLHNLLQDYKPTPGEANSLDPKKFKAPWSAESVSNSPSVTDNSASGVQTQREGQPESGSAVVTDIAKPVQKETPAEKSETVPLDNSQEKPAVVEPAVVEPAVVEPAVKPSVIPSESEKQMPKTATEAEGASGSVQNSSQPATVPEAGATEPGKSEPSILEDKAVEEAVNKAVERMVGSFGLDKRSATQGAAQSTQPTQSIQSVKPTKPSQSKPLIPGLPEETSAESVLTQEYIPVDWKL